MEPLCWGAKVSSSFRLRAHQIVNGLGGADANSLMACMANETGETFSPSIRNMAGSGAVGLIQFMPQTAAHLGTSIEALARMTPEAQLDYVALYLRPFRGRLHNLGDLYCSILWPGGIGKPDSAVLISADDQPSKLYLQNRGLDTNNDREITREEITAAVRAKLARGLLPKNAAV